MAENREALMFTTGKEYGTGSLNKNGIGVAGHRPALVLILLFIP